MEAIMALIILYMRGEPDLTTSIKWVLTILLLGHVWKMFEPLKRNRAKKNN
jgi:hypothetical protein